MAKTKRKALSKKIRFEVFKRDLFTCQYCGRTPPEVVLEVDHVIPVCSGGKSEKLNLLTACFDCNRGKAGNDLHYTMQATDEYLKSAIDREEQLKAYTRLLNSRRWRENKQIAEIECALLAGNGSFSDNLRTSIRTQFIPKLTHDQLLDAAYKANHKCDQPWNATKYFCGICWNIIKEKGMPSEY